MAEILKIYYADDDPDDIYLFRKAIDELHLSDAAKYFNSVDDLVDELSINKGHKSVVFVDYNMPVKTGLDFLNEIHMLDMNTDVDVYVLSTSSSDQHREQAIQSGAIDYLQKSFTYLDFKNMLHQALKPYVRELGGSNSS